MKLSHDTYSNNHAARMALRYGALTAPITMIIYNIISRITTTGDGHITSDIPDSVILLSLAWLLVGTMTFLAQRSRHWLIGVVELGLYAVLAVAQTWFVSGITSPFAVYWVLFLTSAFVLFGRSGLQLSILGFITMVGSYVTYYLSESPVEMLYAVLTTIAVLITNLVVVNVYSSLEPKPANTDCQDESNADQDRLATLVNNITDAVFSTDEHGIVKIYNSAALNLLDTNERIEGRFISELLRLETNDGHDVDVFSELSKNSTIRQRDDLVMHPTDDDMLRLEATFAPVQGSNRSPGAPDSYVLILRDITRMKSLEEERDEFISVVSHELRTPVTIAEGSLDNARLLANRGYHEKVAEALEEAHKQTIFLAKMINDLSTLSRAERGVSDQAEDIDVTELAHQLHLEYTTQAAEKKLAFNLDVKGRPGLVHASPLYLQELLQNFITNAIKYTQTGSVTLKIGKTKQQTVRFEVIDTGIGISKADQQKIFQRFYRTEDYRTRETNGTGLGLYVAAKLARKLGCKIEVDSRLNHGSTFGFELPSVKRSK